jgi:hypothetical protein
MDLSSDTKRMTSAPRPRYRVYLAVGIGCYVLAAIASLFLIADDFGPALLVPLWTVRGGLHAPCVSAAAQ